MLNEYSGPTESDKSVLLHLSGETVKVAFCDDEKHEVWIIMESGDAIVFNRSDFRLVRAPMGEEVIASRRETLQKMVRSLQLVEEVLTQYAAAKANPVQGEGVEPCPKDNV